MKIIIDSFEKLAKREGYLNGKKLYEALGGGNRSYSRIRAGCNVGYEIVKEIYNNYGEKTLLEVVNMEGETVNGLKAKYVAVDNFLY